MQSASRPLPALVNLCGLYVVTAESRECGLDPAEGREARARVRMHFALHALPIACPKFVLLDRYSRAE